jgi:L-fuconolactonase
MSAGPIDAHFHLWRPATLRVPGIIADPRLDRDVLWDDYARAVDGIALEAAVAVQVDGDPGDGEPEVEWFERVAEAHPTLAAIVAWAPLEADDVADHLARLARHPLVRAIRRNTQDEADPMFCARPAFVRGVRALADHGLACDVCVRHWQLDGALGLARACPEVTIVLNHIGKPDLAHAALDPWRDRVSALADLANVVCKLSPVVHGRAEDRWDADSLAPFAAHVLDRFGAARVLWASNWPVAELVMEYGAWLALARRLCAHLAEEGRAAVFSGTARRVYRISGP